jgi:hypothetical protein
VDFLGLKNSFFFNVIIVIPHFFQQKALNNGEIL